MRPALHLIVLIPTPSLKMTLIATIATIDIWDIVV